MRQKCQKKRHSRRGRRAGHKPRDDDFEEYTPTNKKRPGDSQPVQMGKDSFGKIFGIQNPLESVFGKKSEHTTHSGHPPKPAADTTTRNKNVKKPAKVPPKSNTESAEGRLGKPQQSQHESGKATKTSQKQTLTESSKPMTTPQKTTKLAESKVLTATHTKECPKEEITKVESIKTDFKSKKKDEPQELKSEPKVDSVKDAGKSPKKGKKGMKESSQEKLPGKDAKIASATEVKLEGKKERKFTEQQAVHQAEMQEVPVVVGEDLSSNNKLSAQNIPGGLVLSENKNRNMTSKKEKVVHDIVQETAAATVEAPGKNPSLAETGTSIEPASINKDVKKGKVVEKVDKQTNKNQQAVDGKEKQKSRKDSSKAPEQTQSVPSAAPVEDVLEPLQAVGQTTVPKYSDILKSSKKPQVAAVASKATEDHKASKNIKPQKGKAAGQDQLQSVKKDIVSMKEDPKTEVLNVSDIKSTPSPNQPDKAHTEAVKPDLEDKTKDKVSDPISQTTPTTVKGKPGPPTAQSDKKKVKKEKQVKDVESQKAVIPPGFSMAQETKDEKMQSKDLTSDTPTKPADTDTVDAKVDTRSKHVKDLSVVKDEKAGDTKVQYVQEEGIIQDVKPETSGSDVPSASEVIQKETHAKTSKKSMISDIPEAAEPSKHGEAQNVAEAVAVSKVQDSKHTEKPVEAPMAKTTNIEIDVDSDSDVIIDDLFGDSPIPDQEIDEVAEKSVEPVKPLTANTVTVDDDSDSDVIIDDLFGDSPPPPNEDVTEASDANAQSQTVCDVAKEAETRPDKLDDEKSKQESKPSKSTAESQESMTMKDSDNKETSAAVINAEPSTCSIEKIEISAGKPSLVSNTSLEKKPPQDPEIKPSEAKLTEVVPTSGPVYSHDASAKDITATPVAETPLQVTAAPVIEGQKGDNNETVTTDKIKEVNAVKPSEGLGNMAKKAECSLQQVVPSENVKKESKSISEARPSKVNVPGVSEAIVIASGEKEAKSELIVQSAPLPTEEVPLKSLVQTTSDVHQESSEEHSPVQPAINAKEKGQDTKEIKEQIAEKTKPTAKHDIPLSDKSSSSQQDVVQPKEEKDKISEKPVPEKPVPETAITNESAIQTESAPKVSNQQDVVQPKEKKDKIPEKPVPETAVTCENAIQAESAPNLSNQKDVVQPKEKKDKIPEKPVPETAVTCESAIQAESAPKVSNQQDVVQPKEKKDKIPEKPVPETAVTCESAIQAESAPKVSNQQDVVQPKEKKDKIPEKPVPEKPVPETGIISESAIQAESAPKVSNQQDVIQPKEKKDKIPERPVPEKPVPETGIISESAIQAESAPKVSNQQDVVQPKETKDKLSEKHVPETAIICESAIQAESAPKVNNQQDVVQPKETKDKKPEPVSETAIASGSASQAEIIPTIRKLPEEDTQEKDNQIKVKEGKPEKNKGERSASAQTVKEDQSHQGERSEMGKDITVPVVAGTPVNVSDKQAQDTEHPGKSMVLITDDSKFSMTDHVEICISPSALRQTLTIGELLKSSSVVSDQAKVSKPAETSTKEGGKEDPNLTPVVKQNNGKEKGQETESDMDASVRAYLVEEASRLQQKVQAEVSEEKSRESLSSKSLTSEESLCTTPVSKVQTQISQEMPAVSEEKCSEPLVIKSSIASCVSANVKASDVSGESESKAVGQLSAKEQVQTVKAKPPLDVMQQAIYQDMVQDCSKMQTKGGVLQAEINFHEKNSQTSALVGHASTRIPSAVESELREVEEDVIMPEEEIVALAAPKRPAMQSSNIQEHLQSEEIRHQGTNNQGAVIAAVLQECQTQQLRLIAERAETAYNEGQQENERESSTSDADVSDKENIDPGLKQKEQTKIQIMQDVTDEKEELVTQQGQAPKMNVEPRKCEIVQQESLDKKNTTAICAPCSAGAGVDINVFLDMEMTVETEEPQPVIETSMASHLDTIEEEHNSTASREDLSDGEFKEIPGNVQELYKNNDHLKSIYASLSKECEEMWRLYTAVKCEAMYQNNLALTSLKENKKASLNNHPPMSRAEDKNGDMDIVIENTSHLGSDDVQSVETDAVCTSSQEFTAEIETSKKRTCSVMTKAVQESLMGEYYWMRLSKEAEQAEKHSLENKLSRKNTSTDNLCGQSLSKSSQFEISNPRSKLCEVENTKSAITVNHKPKITVKMASNASNPISLGKKPESDHKDELNTSPLCNCKDATSQTEIEFSVCCRCGLLTLPLPAQLSERLRRALLQQEKSEALIESIEGDLDLIRNSLEVEKKKATTLEEQNCALEVELAAEKNAGVQLKQSILEYQEKLDEQKRQIEKLEDKVNNASSTRDTDVLDKVRHAVSKATEAQERLKETELELQRSQSLASKLQQELDYAVREMSNMDIIKESEQQEEALKQATARAQEAELRASNLELQLAKLQGESDIWLSGKESQTKTDDPWKTPSSTSSGLFPSLGGYYQGGDSTFGSLTSSAFTSQPGSQFMTQPSTTVPRDERGYRKTGKTSANSKTDDSLSSAITFHDLDENFSVAESVLGDLYPESPEVKVTSSSSTTPMGSALGTYSMLYGSLGPSTYGEQSQSSEEKTSGRLFGSSLYDSSTARALFGDDYASTALTSSYITSKYGGSAFGQEMEDYDRGRREKPPTGQDALGLAGIVGTASSLPTSSTAASIGGDRLLGTTDMANITMWSTPPTGSLTTGVLTASGSDSESASDWSSSSDEPEIEQVDAPSSTPAVEPVSGFREARPPGVLPKPAAVKLSPSRSLADPSKFAPFRGPKPTPPPGKPKLPLGRPAAADVRSKPAILPKPRMRAVVNSNHAPVMNAGAGAAEAGEERGVSFEEGHQQASLRSVKKPRGPAQRRLPHRYKR